MKKASEGRFPVLALCPKRDKLALVSDEHDPPDSPKEKADPPKAKGEDVVMVHSPTEDGQGYHVLRMREGTMELGQIRNMREGAPVHGDVVRLSQRSDHERLYDVEVLVKSPKPPEAPKAGPAQVATDAYRTNWDMIFGAGRANGGNNAPN